MEYEFRKRREVFLAFDDLQRHARALGMDKYLSRQYYFDMISNMTGYKPETVRKILNRG